MALEHDQDTQVAKARSPVEEELIGEECECPQCGAKFSEFEDIVIPMMIVPVIIFSIKRYKILKGKSNRHDVKSKSENRSKMAD